jgi:hypothetical protein
MNYYFESESEDLETIESGILQLETVVKGTMVAIALGLGKIKMEKLYQPIASSFREYLSLRRININQSTAYGLAKAGENMWRYREYLEEKGVKLSRVLQKMRYVNPVVAEKDPRLWTRINELSEHSFRMYVRQQTRVLTGIIGADKVQKHDSDVFVRGASLIIGGKPVKGINLNRFRENTTLGKRPIVLWVKDDDKLLKKIRRHNRQFIV